MCSCAPKPKAWGETRLKYSIGWRIAVVAFVTAVSSFGQTGVSTFVSSDGPHIAYVDESGNLSQIWYTVATNEWAYQTLYPGASLHSGIATWTQSDGPHIAYVDQSGNLNEEWYTTATGAWSHSVIHSGVIVSSAMSAWIQSDGPHIAYVDSSGTLWQTWYTIASNLWQSEELAFGASPSSGITTWIQSDGPHIAYVDQSGNLNQEWYTTTAAVWSHSVIHSGVIVSSAMSAWIQSDGPHIAYVDSSGTLWQTWYTIASNLWQSEELAFGASPGSGITTWVQSDGPHIAYVGTNGNLSQTWYTLASGLWQSQPLASGASLNTGVSAWIQSDGPHIAYIDQNGNIWQEYYATANGVWNNQSITDFVDNPPASITHTISGQVLAGSSGLPGATVTLTGTTAAGASISLSTTTNANGNYSFAVPAGGNYTITSSLSGYAFSPVIQTFDNLSTNQTAVPIAVANQPAVWTNYDGRLEAFYSLNGAINNAWQQSAAVEQNWVLNSSMGWAMIGSPAAASNGDGRLEVFAEGTDRNLYHNWQLTPGGSWSGWSLLANGPLAQPPSVIETSDGTLQVFAVINNVVYVDQETTPENSSSWTGWTQLAGATISTTPSLIRTYTGDLYIFAQGTDSGAWQNIFSASSGTWGGWSSLGGVIFGSPTAALNLDGSIQIFALGEGNVPYGNWEETPGSGWSGWTSLGGTLEGPPTPVVNADGRIEIFGLSGATTVHNWQENPGGTWSGWNSLGGNFNSPISAFRNVDGRVEIFDQTSSGAVWQNYQITPGGSWSGWYAINSASTPVASSSTTYPGFGTIGGPSSAAENDGFWNFANKAASTNATPTQDINGWPIWNCAHVAVSFVGFPTKYNNALQRALDNWNKKLTAMGVSLGLPGPPVVFARDSGDGSHASVTVRYLAIVPDSGPLCTSAQPVSNFTTGYTHLCTAQQVGGYIQHVNIDINPNIQVAGTITNVLAHELGHTFQLADCNKCAFESVMTTFTVANANSPFYSACKTDIKSLACAKQAVNFTQGAPGPTSADIAAVEAKNTQLWHCSNEAYNEPISCVDGSSPSVSEGFASDGTTGEPVTSCDGTVCDSCNANCFSFAPVTCSGASTGTGGGSSGGGSQTCEPLDISCSDGAAPVCVDDMWICDGDDL